tara:strand:+ start:56 stop:310 length:255 start_codon:yes stop_codon:yes gene_type:complete
MIRAFNNLTYATVDSNDLSKLDFDLISQTSPETLRYSIDLSQFLISWIIEPPFIQDGTVIPDGLYTHEECLELIETPAWTSTED